MDHEGIDLETPKDRTAWLHPGKDDNRGASKTKLSKKRNYDEIDNKESRS
jgi:hypothetical protein